MNTQPAVVALIAVAVTGCSEPDSKNDQTTNANDQTAPYDGPSARGEARFGFALVAPEESPFMVSTYEPEFDEAQCASDCEGNTAPVLDPPIFVINGAILDEPAAALDDDFAIFVAFRDAECNLSCGSRSDSQIEPEGAGDSIASLPSNVPCSTDESNVYFRLTPGAYPLDPGHYEYNVWLEDSCGERSNRQTIEFDLQ